MGALPELGRQHGPVIVEHVRQDDVGAFRREAPAGSRSNAARATGDEGDTPGQALRLPPGDRGPSPLLLYADHGICSYAGNVRKSMNSSAIATASNAWRRHGVAGRVAQRGQLLFDNSLHQLAA